VKFYTPKIKLTRSLNNSDSASKIELINLIQIKESVVVTLPIFSVVFTYFQLHFSYVLKQRTPGILWVQCPFSHESGWVPLISHVFWQNIHQWALLFIHNRQFVGFLNCTNKKPSSIYRHKIIVIYCALISGWNIKRCLQFRRNSNLQ